MRPSIYVVHLAQCAVGVGMCVWLEEIFPMIACVLGELELEELCDFCVRNLWGFPKVFR